MLKVFYKKYVLLFLDKYMIIRLLANSIDYFYELLLILILKASNNVKMLKFQSNTLNYIEVISIN